MNSESRRVSLIAHLVRPAISICLAAVVVTGIVVVSRHLSTTTLSANTSAQPLGCQRSLTAAEIQSLQAQGIQVTAYQGASSINEQDAFAMGSAQLAPNAQSKATAIACQLVTLNAPNISPPATHFVPIKGLVSWIILFQSIGPGSHGQNASTSTRNLYMFFDANSGIYLFSISAPQP